MAIMKMLAFITPGARPCPRLYDEVVGFVEHFTVIGRVGVVEELLAASATYPTGDQPAPGDQVNGGEFFGHTQRMFKHRQRIADEDNLNSER